MADYADCAQELAERLEEVKKRYAPVAVIEPSLSDCDMCGGDIPLQRQQAVAGCRLCVGCQDYVERKRC